MAEESSFESTLSELYGLYELYKPRSSDGLHSLESDEEGVKNQESVESIQVSSKERCTADAEKVSARKPSSESVKSELSLGSVADQIERSISNQLDCLEMYIKAERITAEGQASACEIINDLRLKSSVSDQESLDVSVLNFFKYWQDKSEEIDFNHPESMLVDEQGEHEFEPIDNTSQKASRTNEGTAKLERQRSTFHPTNPLRTAACYEIEMGESRVIRSFQHSGIDIRLKGTKGFSKEQSRTMFCLSEFVNTHQDGQDGHLNKYVTQLDELVSISTSNRAYAQVYDGINIITDEIRDNLLSSHTESYLSIIKRPTGSAYADLKVGLPHEADFLLEIASKQPVKLSTFCRHIKPIAKQCEFLQKSNEWLLHDVQEHKAGVCLVMEYRPNGCVENAVGVTVDLIPVYKVHADEAKLLQLTRDALMYLKHYSVTYSTGETSYKQDLYMLLQGQYRVREFDTGVISNQILKDLDEVQKRGIRVAKFLLQRLTNQTPNFSVNNLSEERCRSLYGDKPLVRSYFLRQCFLKLLLQTHDEDIRAMLNSGLLVLCLFEMIKVIQPKDFGCFDLTDPIQVGTTKPITCGCTEKINSLVKDFLAEAEAGDLGGINLMNSDSN